MSTEPDDALMQAAAELVAETVADLRREWERELETLRAERRALVAELRLAALGVSVTADAVPAAPDRTPDAKAKRSKARGNAL